jgi:hypothetical protein
MEVQSFVNDMNLAVSALLFLSNWQQRRPFERGRK